MQGYGLPILTAEEALLLAEKLCGQMSDGQEKDLEALVEELGESKSVLEGFEEEFEAWRQGEDSEEFAQKVSKNLRRARHLKRLNRSWKKLDRLSNRVRDEYELVLGAFFPEKFESNTRYLGEGDGEKFEIPGIVSPFMGVAWNTSGFKVVPADYMADAEFEVTSEAGEILYSKLLQGTDELVIEFSDAGIGNGDSVTWCLSYCEDGEFEALSGKVHLPSEEDRLHINTIFDSFGEDVEANNMTLLKTMVYVSYRCFDSALRGVMEELARSENQEFRRELNLLLHEIYEKAREDYLAQGLQKEANMILKAIFEVEGELEELSLLEE